MKADAPLSVMLVEVFGQPPEGYQPLSGHLGYYSIVRTSLLTPVPKAC